MHLKNVKILHKTVFAKVPADLRKNNTKYDQKANLFCHSFCCCAEINVNKCFESSVSVCTWGKEYFTKKTETLFIDSILLQLKVKILRM